MNVLVKWCLLALLALFAIAAKLNERNFRTARGGTWTHVQVGAILHPFGGAGVVAVV